MPFNPSDPDPTVSPPQQAGNTHAFYAELFNQLPVLVVRLTTDGIVLEINTQVTLVTGYAPDQLLGRNFWATLFPGKLFAQVPRFISPTAPWGLFRDYPMALRTRNGLEKIIAWTRFLRHASVPQPNGNSSPNNSTREEVICLGLDLTNRLTAAESQLVEQLRTGDFGKNGIIPPTVTNAASLDSQDQNAALDSDHQHSGGTPKGTNSPAPESPSDAGLVEPLAVSPPPPPSGTVTAESLANLQQALDLLQLRSQDLHGAVALGQSARLEMLSELLPACVKPAFGAPLATVLSLEKNSDPRTLGLIETMQESAHSLGKLAARSKGTEKK